MTSHLITKAPLAVTILALFWPAFAVAQENASINCALLRDGVKRLACYDTLNNPKTARDEASEEEVESVERTADTMAPGRKEVIGGSGEEDPDNNAMANIVERYLKAEKALFSFSGSFLSHRPTYILPITWTDNPNQTPSSPRLGNTLYDYDLENEEAKYQISFKVPLLTGLFDDGTTLWFGYTQRSFWQVYNKDDSAPFRETNYEPEIFLRHETNWNLGAVTLAGVTLGFNHESNGQSEPRSRSWNRVMASAAFTHGRWLFVVKPWYRIPEGSEDDNKDIERYLGYADYNIVYKLAEDRTFSLRFMNNLRSDNRTSVEFGYSFPMGDTIRGFFQYYNGYGESLIDYNHRIERFGIGIMLNDWL